ncbi:hypothetical protein ACU8KH_02408 [Lachancea thermotolerans]
MAQLYFTSKDHRRFSKTQALGLRNILPSLMHNEKGHDTFRDM